MKVLLLGLMLLAVLAQATRNTEAEDVIRGIIEGAYGDMGKQVHECIQDGTSILSAMNVVAKDFDTALKRGDEASFLEAFEYLGDILRTMVDEIKTCGDFEEMVKDIPRMADQFTYPEPIIIGVNKVIWRGNVITSDVSSTVDELNQQHFEESGKMIGDIIKSVFFDYKIQDPVDNVSDLLTEFWRSAFNLTLNLNTCKSEITASVYKFINDTQTLIQCRSAPECFALIKQLIDDGEYIYHRVDDCSAAYPIIQAGVLNLKRFYDNPGRTIIALLEAIIFDPISYPRDIYYLIRALISKPLNYKQIGSVSGDLIHMILYYMPKSMIALE